MRAGGLRRCWRGSAADRAGCRRYLCSRSLRRDRAGMMAASRISLRWTSHQALQFHARTLRCGLHIYSRGASTTNISTRNRGGLSAATAVAAAAAAGTGMMIAVVVRESCSAQGVSAVGLDDGYAPRTTNPLAVIRVAQTMIRLCSARRPRLRCSIAHGAQRQQCRHWKLLITQRMMLYMYATMLLYRVSNCWTTESRSLPEATQTTHCLMLQALASLSLRTRTAQSRSRQYCSALGIVQQRTFARMARLVSRVSTTRT